MNEDHVRENILRILHRAAPEADLTRLDPEGSLREALDIDSFDFLKVIIALQEQLGINVPESDYKQVSTLRGMIGYIASRSPQA